MTMESSRIVLCNYCNRQAKLASGATVYQHRPDLAAANVWICRPCDAWVGCHMPGTWGFDAEGRKVVHVGDEPKGRLADAALRLWKRRAHAAFDPLWKTGAMKRIEAYGWLAAALGIQEAHCHIGMFDVAQCQAAEKVALAYIHANGIRPITLRP